MPPEVPEQQFVISILPLRLRQVHFYNLSKELAPGCSEEFRQLAPDIQEAILNLEPTTDHVPRFREREVRTIAILPNWEKQRILWKRLVKRTS